MSIPTCYDLSVFAEKLRQYFEAFGAVQDAVVMKDPVSRRSRGFGFITFEHTSFVDNVLERDVHVIDSRKVITQLCYQRVTIFYSRKRHSFDIYYISG